uniref:Uncharacterized protein n=1 Tax=Branchiostoma floridae TaxID=7739 RepID=C3YKA1_BRAFL|eukprot:XP_002603251.1 hypothetical protein BRAFLDRAFT_226372 [Branchiostoma floridae]
MKGLEERVRNTEDKLAAAEQSKLLLAEELSTVSDVRHKVHSDLETAVLQVDTLKMRLKKAEESYAKKEKDLLDEMSESLVQSEDDLKHQVDDLKVRLEMGAEAYREKYRECHKLEKSIKKLSGGKVRKTASYHSS